MRTSFEITLTTWKALFLREAVARLFAGRVAWLWMLLEPVVHITFMLFIFTVVRMKTVGGMDVVTWLLSGMLAFLLFRRTGTQCMNAINANQALFTYRQVKPIDTVLVRGGLEFLLLLVVASILVAVTALLGLATLPDDPLELVVSILCLWLLGVGFGLMASVAKEMIPELGKILDLLMTPMYFFSGVIFPIGSIPPPYREWLMLNPVAQGVEAIRLSFSSYYHAIPELNLPYLYASVLFFVFIGLALQVRYAGRVVTR
jgi:capsular polysaccharide transport system permease protein